MPCRWAESRHRRTSSPPFQECFRWCPHRRPPGLSGQRSRNRSLGMARASASGLASASAGVGVGLASASSGSWRRRQGWGRRRRSASGPGWGLASASGPASASALGIDPFAAVDRGAANVAYWHRDRRVTVRVGSREDFRHAASVCAVVIVSVLEPIVFPHMMPDPTRTPWPCVRAST